MINLFLLNFTESFEAALYFFDVVVVVADPHRFTSNGSVILSVDPPDPF